MGEPLHGELPSDGGDGDFHARRQQACNALTCARSPVSRPERLEQLAAGDAVVPAGHFDSGLGDLGFGGERLERLHFAEPTERPREELTDRRTPEQGSVEIEDNQSMAR